MTAPALQNFTDEIDRLAELGSVVCSISANSDNWVESFPLPAWVTAPTGEMEMFNEGYARVYKKDRKAYFGRKNSAAWRADVARGFDANNVRVMRERRPMTFWEYLAPDHVILVLKFPVYDSHNELVGVGGIVLSDDRADGIPRIAAALAQGPAA